MSLGRPSSYTDEIADRVCEAIAAGGALYLICERPDMPGESTVYQWLAAKPDFAEKYARARERQQDRRVDEIIEIADKDDDPNRARVRIDARKWAASKLAPKKYGDRVTNEVVGEGGGPVIVSTVERKIVRPNAGD